MEKCRQSVEGVYLVTDETLEEEALLHVVGEALEAGVSAVQHREKKSSSKDFYRRALRLKKMADSRRVPFIINDRVDLALATRASGVHLGQSDLPVAEARRILGTSRIIGLSAETRHQVAAANSIDIDYLAVSPVFSTSTKMDIRTPFGLKGLKWSCNVSRHPLVAIGGINSLNAKNILDAGAVSLAVISDICRSPSPFESTRKLISIVLEHAKGRASRSRMEQKRD